MTRVWGRAVAGVVAAALTVLVAEGASSLWRGRSLFGARPTPVALRPGLDDARLEAGAADNRGINRAHPDPRVGFVLRRGGEVSILDATVSSDRLGMRRRPGPSPADDATRVVVLGDSVAFGFGLDDDATIGAALERELQRRRAASTAPVAVWTVAMPGWNHRNAVSFLLDHWDAYAPDVVVYLPIPNDLDDALDVLESGHKRYAPDLMQADPWLLVENLRAKKFQAALAARGVTLADDLGPAVLLAGASAHSRARYEANVDSIARLGERLQRDGGTLLLAHYKQGTYAAVLAAHLARRGLQPPTIALLARGRPEFTLGVDPHPNAETATVLARWIADEVLARGWIEAAPGAAPSPVPAAYSDDRAPALDAAALTGLAAQIARTTLAQLGPVIDFADGRGTSQVYGGIHDEGFAGPRLLALLAVGGPTVVVEAAALPGRPDLYPLDVAITIDGADVATLRIEPGSRARVDAPVPAGVSAVEVGLLASEWVVVETDGPDELAAFVPLRIAATSR